MLIYSGTGVTKVNDLRITKSPASLLFRTDKNLDEIVNETITIQVERANGNNTDIATNIPLLDFILLSTYGTSAVYKDNDFNTCALCELTPEFAINLNENERVIIKMDGLNPAKTYSINSIEEPVTADAVIYFDVKTVLSEETRRKFDVSNYESVCFTNPNQITELILKFDNGQTCRYLKEEIFALSIDTDPIAQVKADGTNVSIVANKLVFPLFGVEEIEIQKNEGQLVKMVLKDDKIG